MPTTNRTDRLAQLEAEIPAWIKYLCASLLCMLSILLAWIYLSDFLGNDWLYAFQPAATAFLTGEDPYLVDQFMLAPWTLILFIPLSFLPDALAVAILRILGLVTYGYVAIRLKVKPLGLFFLLLSPQTMHNLINGNIDWLAFLGFVLPPQIGLFFLAIKPQIGVVLMLYILGDAIKQKKVIRTFSPLLVVSAFSFILFGLWPVSFSSVQAAYNASLWPYSLPIGLVLLVTSLRKHNIRIARAISPLFSPHVMFHSWATVLFALVPDTKMVIIAVIISWILVGISTVV